MSSQLTNYEKLAELETTAFATVYRGYDHAGERDVRIIEFHEVLAADPDRWSQIWSEAVSMVALSHQNSVSVFAPLKEQRWIVTEWLSSDLGALLSRRKMTADEVRNVLRQILRVLAALHERGKLHGDVRPGNLLFNDGDFVKLNYSPGLELGGQALIREQGLKYYAPELFDPTAFGVVGSGVDLYRSEERRVGK